MTVCTHTQNNLTSKHNTPLTKRPKICFMEKVEEEMADIIYSYSALYNYIKCLISYHCCQSLIRDIL